MTLVQMHGPADAFIVIGFTVGCALLAALIAWRGRIDSGRDQLTAALRATLQLALVGAIITVVLKSWWLTGLFCAAMITIAGLTSGRRITHSWTGWTILPVALGSVVGATGMVASTLMPVRPVAFVPIFGILTGGAMTATTLAGRSMHSALTDHFDAYEGALALGLTQEVSTNVVARPSASLGLIPGLDQTRTVGLVTLPGAFVGALLGGASALQASAIQLMVLAALLVVQAIAVLTTTELLVRGRLGTVQPPSR